MSTSNLDDGEQEVQASFDPGFATSLKESFKMNYFEDAKKDSPRISLHKNENGNDSDSGIQFPKQFRSLIQLRRCN